MKKRKRYRSLDPKADHLPIQWELLREKAIELLGWTECLRLLKTVVAPRTAEAILRGEWEPRYPVGVVLEAAVSEEAPLTLKQIVGAANAANSRPLTALAWDIGQPYLRLRGWLSLGKEPTYSDGVLLREALAVELPLFTKFCSHFTDEPTEPSQDQESHP